MGETMKIYLTLENGKIFEGESFGAVGEVIGETVFTTSMTGYLETLTDPSYFGQIVVQTFPLIGNYGVIPADFESNKVNVQAYIVREWCQYPSNFRCEDDIDTFLKAQNIIGMYGIDTRELTKLIRENGVLNGMISLRKPSERDMERIKKYTVKNAVAGVTCNKTQMFGKGKYNVVLMDFGCKRNIINCLADKNCRVYIVPSYTSAEEILKLAPDGIMLSNGPGDPSENIDIINQLKILVKSKIPIFGICLGHQLLALANGGKTQKLKYGHRGGNQPVLDVERDRIYITSQNHGYAVVNGSIPKKTGYVSHINLNDHTCEGIRYYNSPAFSVQFHPEAASGPLDTQYLFDNFISLMEGSKCR